MGWQALHALHCWISKSFDVNTVLQSKFKWTSDLNDCIHSAVNSGQVYIHFTECANVSILHAFECEIIYSSYISILCAVCHWFIRFVANLRLTNINMKCVMNVSLCVCVYAEALSLSTHSYSDVIWLHVAPWKPSEFRPILCVHENNTNLILYTHYQLPFNNFNMQFSTKYMCLNVVWFDWFVVHDREICAPYSDI